MSDDPPPQERLEESLRLATDQLTDAELEAFVLVSMAGGEANVTVEADQVHDETEMPMPQVLLATLIYNYAQQTGTRPLRIGQAATYAAENIFKDATDYEFVTNLDDDLHWEGAEK